MPYLLIHTNIDLPDEKQDVLLKALSASVAAELGKPVAYVMAGFAPKQRMIFAGSDDPTAFISLKSIGFPEDSVKSMTAALCKLVSGQTGIPASRIFVQIDDVKAKYWGLDGNTFG